MRKNMNILVLCTGNSCRSQMLQGFLMQYPELTVYSAGIETHGLSLQAVRVMNETGIDISGHTSNHVNEYMDIDFSYVITVCDHAQEQCPLFPGSSVRLHRNFPDPARATGTEEEVLEAFRTVRDDIRVYSSELITIFRAAEKPGIEFNITGN